MQYKVGWRTFSSNHFPVGRSIRVIRVIKVAQKQETIEKTFLITVPNNTTKHFYFQLKGKVAQEFFLSHIKTYLILWWRNWFFSGLGQLSAVRGQDLGRLAYWANMIICVSLLNMYKGCKLVLVMYLVNLLNSKELNIALSVLSKNGQCPWSLIFLVDGFQFAEKKLWYSPFTFSLVVCFYLWRRIFQDAVASY